MVESQPPQGNPSSEPTYSGSGPDERDPAPLGQAIQEFVGSYRPGELPTNPEADPETLLAKINELRSKRADLIERKNAGDPSAPRELVDVMDNLAKTEVQYAALRISDNAPE